MKELLKKLVQADTTVQKGELSAAQVILDELGRYGIEARIDSWDQTRANIVARVKSAGSRAAVLFACHLDVVWPGEASWRYPPFGGIESGGRIYGRGSADMKGGIAAAVTAIGQVVEAGAKLQGDIIFVAAAGEETDSCGAKKFACDCSWLPKLAGVVITEPTDFEVVTSHRGMLWLEVTTKGKAAHSSAPQLGINAIILMKDVLNALENYRIPYQPHKLLGGCSMSVNTISGGKAMNVVPDKCTVGIDIRTLPSQNHRDIISDLEKIFGELKSKDPQSDAQVSVIREVGPLETDSNCDFVKGFCSAVGTNRTKAVGFTTDGPCFAFLGAPVVIFGPGDPEVCHKVDEHIEISDVEKAAEHYKNIILKFLA